MDKTGRGAGVGVGNRWIKPGGWEVEDHVIHKMMNAAFDGMASHSSYKWLNPSV